MDSNDETGTEAPVRKTRSGRVVKPAASAKSPKSPKTPGRKSKKKVVLMEVEVSDDDEDVHAHAENESNESNKEANEQHENSKETNETAEEEEKEEILQEIQNSDKELVVSLKKEDFEVDKETNGTISTLAALEEAVQSNINELSHNIQEETKVDMEVDSEEPKPVEVETIKEDNKPMEDFAEVPIQPDEINEPDVEMAEVAEAEQPIEAEELKEIEEPKEVEEPKVVEEPIEAEKLEDVPKEKIDSENKELKQENIPENANGFDELSDSEQAGEKETSDSEQAGEKDTKQNGDPDAENISEDELPGVQVAKVPETEEVSDEELPGPKRAELPADTEVVSEDELPSVKKEGSKRKLAKGEYDPGSPTSENEAAPAKKPALEPVVAKEKEEKPPKPKKLPELDKYWKAVNDDPTDFTGWTYLLQYVDQENDMEAAREAYDAFLSHYPYCYGYWRKYADYEKRKGNKKKCEEVFERGFKAIPLSVDLWIHYMTYVKSTKGDDEEFVRAQFERAITACGLEFRSDRLWDSYMKWETEAKRLQHVTAIYDRLLATPTQGYTTHFDNFQEHITGNPPNKVVEVDEFLALRKEVRHSLKQDSKEPQIDSDAPPGDEDSAKLISTDEETKAIRERIISIRRKIHKNTVSAVTSRWNFEEGIKRPYFHVKPLERCQLKNWQDYLDFEIAKGDQVRIVVLFERCLIACALYEEFWLKFVHYLEGLNDPELQNKIRDVYERACTIHHLKKPNLHLQWAMFEECIQNYVKAAEILVNLEKSVPNVLQIAYRRINLERRREDHEKCCQLFEHYITNSKNKMISSNIAIKYSRFCLKVLKNTEKANETLKSAISKDPNNPRLYLQLIDLTLQKEGIPEKDVIDIIDSFLEKESTDSEQKVLFAQRKLEFLEDFGSDITSVQKAYEEYQKHIKQNKDSTKKKEAKSETALSNKKDKPAAPQSSASNTYNYGSYGNSGGQGSYQYSSSPGQYGYSQYGQGGEQYQYPQGWQYPQGNYGGYNQWGSYGGGYGY